MAKSLQDQLRQAGLASQKQVVKARKAKNTKEKMQRKGAVVVDETAEHLQQQKTEKLAKDRALNDAKNKALEERAIQAQIQQMVDMNAVDSNGETEFRYEQAGKIKTIFVNSDVRNALIKGHLCIAGDDERHFVIPLKVAQKISERDSKWILLMNAQSPENADTKDEYAGYEVPDDLMW